MLNGIPKKDMSKNYRVKVNNFVGSTSATNLENINQIVKCKPECLIVHAGTNNSANRTNLLNQTEKSLVSQKSFPKHQNCIFEHYYPERP